MVDVESNGLEDVFEGLVLHEVEEDVEHEEFLVVEGTEKRGQEVEGYIAELFIVVPKDRDGVVGEDVADCSTDPS